MRPLKQITHSAAKENKKLEKLTFFRFSVVLKCVNVMF